MFAGGPLFCSVIKFKVGTGTVPKRFRVLIVIVHVVSLSRCEFKVGDFKDDGSLANVLKSGAGRYLKGPSRRVFAVIARGIVGAETSIGHLKRDGVAFIVQLSIYSKKRVMMSVEESLLSQEKMYNSIVLKVEESILKRWEQSPEQLHGEVFQLSFLIGTVCGCFCALCLILVIRTYKRKYKKAVVKKAIYAV